MNHELTFNRPKGSCWKIATNGINVDKLLKSCSQAITTPVTLLVACGWLVDNGEKVPRKNGDRSYNRMLTVEKLHQYKKPD